MFNPLQVAAYRKSGVREVKTDKTDAVCIATSCALPICLPLVETFQLCFYCVNSAYSSIGSRTRSATANAICYILHQVFPEYESLFSNVFIRSSRALLQEAVSAQEFASFDLTN